MKRKQKEVNINSIVSVLDQIYQHTGSYSAFTDWIDTMLYALMSDQTPNHPTEKEYLKVITKYKKEDVKLFGEAFGMAMEVMRRTNQEVLGIIYQQVSGMWKAKALGQFFTPPHVADLMAQIVVGNNKEGNLIVNDPACGAGQMLISYGKFNPTATLVGQDLDLICTKMTALNMCFFNFNAYIINGDSLQGQVLEAYQTYRTGLGGQIKKLTDSGAKMLEEILRQKREDKQVQEIQQMELFDLVKKRV